MEKVRPWCGQPSDWWRLKNRTEQFTQVLSDRLLSSMAGGPYCGFTESMTGVLCDGDRGCRAAVVDRLTMKSDVPVWRTQRYTARNTFHFKTRASAVATEARPRPASLAACRCGGRRRIIIRPSSVVVSLRRTVLNDIAKSTTRKSVTRQIDTPPPSSSE